MTNLFTWLGDLLLGIWRSLHKLTYWFYASVLVLLYFVAKSIFFIGEHTIRLMQMAASLMDSALGYGSSGCPGSFGIGSILQIANTFFPLDEAVGLAADAILIWLGIGAYTFLKSWLSVHVLGWGISGNK